MKGSDYYLSRKSDYLKELGEFLEGVYPEFVRRFGEEKATEFRQDVISEFNDVLPLLPYIGGDENILTFVLPQAGWSLAVYRAMQKHNGTVEQAAELIYRGFEAKFRKFTTEELHKMGRDMFASNEGVQRFVDAAERSQKREFPYDWVLKAIPGDGKEIDMTFIYEECAIDKLFRDLGVEELTPYCCNLDYLIFGARGLGLKRTKTLAWGCDCCDFEVKIGGDIIGGWPPTFPERTCGQ